MASKTRRAIVCGGSIGGLFAANALVRAGWHVDVYERTSVELSGRGAGIVTHKELLSALEQLGADLTNLGVSVQERVAFDKNGQRVATLDYPQIVTSWDRIHQILRACIPNEQHHLGLAVTGYETDNDRAIAIFDDGTHREADLLVGADGFRSAIRAQMLPQVVPEYAGYVVWRALAAEGDIPPSTRDEIFGTFGFYAPSGTQIIGYPISGTENDLREGHRRYNFVWYVPVSQDVLEDMLTDKNGERYATSIPPPLIRDDILKSMQTVATERLPKAFLDVLAVSERPFFTPIYDHHSPVMAQGSVALAGDAACVARPHVGMGVTKAAQDALSLVKHLETSSVFEGLKAYSDERVHLSKRAYDQAQLLGTYMLNDFPTGPVHGGPENPNLDAIMNLTAAVP